MASHSRKVNHLETFEVVLSPITMAFLNFDNFKSKYIQEGFLLGQLTETTIEKTTDSDDLVLHRKRELLVEGSVICPLSARFYDAYGRIDVKKVSGFLGDLAKRVIGWYRFKPNSPIQNMTFREVLIHKQLGQLLSLPFEFFTYCLLTSRISEVDKIYSFNRLFLTIRHGTFRTIPLTIIHFVKQETYKHPTNYSDKIKQVVEEARAKATEPRGVPFIKKIQEVIQERISASMDTFVEAEKLLGELEAEVEALKTQAKTLETN